MGAQQSRQSRLRRSSSTSTTITSTTQSDTEARIAGYWPPSKTPSPMSARSRTASTTSELPDFSVTRPSLPREITHLSNLIDPNHVAGDWTIRSPSGNLLGLGGYLNHPDRPLSMRERQEKVRKAMATMTVVEEEKRKSSGSGRGPATRIAVVLEGDDDIDEAGSRPGAKRRFIMPLERKLLGTPNFGNDNSFHTVLNDKLVARSMNNFHTHDTKNKVWGKALYNGAAEQGTSKSKLRCRFHDQGCTVFFFTQREEIRHLNNEDGNGHHEFCEKCDEWYYDWGQFLEHKVVSENHLACAACGKDFESQSGLEGHIRRQHPKKTPIACIGCKNIYIGCAAFLGHLEKGRCRKISSQEFEAQVKRHEIIEEVLKNPERQAPFEGQPPLSESVRGTADTSSTILESDTTDINTIAPLKPTKISTSSKIEDRGWPTLPSSAATGIRKQPFIINEDGSDPSSSATVALSTLIIDKVLSTASVSQPQESFPALGSKPSSNVTVGWGSVGGNNTSKKLFPDAKTQPVSAATTAEVFNQAISQKNKEYSAQYGNPVPSGTTTSVVPGEAVTPGWRGVSTTTASKHALSAAPSNWENLFSARLWDSSFDPDTPGFNSEKFFNHVINRYECPFKHCTQVFDEPIHLSDHLQSTIHKPTYFQCPSCFKVFKTRTALVGHCEAVASPRCRIRDSKKYKMLLDGLSGGFLSKSGAFDEEGGAGKGKGKAKVGSGLADVWEEGQQNQGDADDAWQMDDQERRRRERRERRGDFW